MTGEPVAEDKGPLESAADLFLYAPVGLAAAARDLLPTLAERGRAEVASQVSLARMVGQMVMRQGQGEVGKAVGGARQQVGSLLDQLLRTFSGSDGLDETPAPPPPPPDPVAPVVVAPDEPVPPVEEPVEPVEEPVVVVEPVEAPVDTAGVAPAVPAVASLAIPDYESLAASQVIPRLASLAPDELDAVRAYEAATRGRRTVLGRIAQLQG